jgi:hypothetical protein
LFRHDLVCGEHPDVAGRGHQSRHDTRYCAHMPVLAVCRVIPPALLPPRLPPSDIARQ